MKVAARPSRPMISARDVVIPGKFPATGEDCWRAPSQTSLVWLPEFTGRPWNPDRSSGVTTRGPPGPQHLDISGRPRDARPPGRVCQIPQVIAPFEVIVRWRWRAPGAPTYSPWRGHPPPRRHTIGPSPPSAIARLRRHRAMADQAAAAAAWLLRCAIRWPSRRSPGTLTDCASISALAGCQCRPDHCGVAAALAGQ